MADRKNNRCPQKLRALSRRELVARLSEAEESLRAIRSGEVDAIVVNGQGGEKVFTLQGADLKDVTLADFAGQREVPNIVPSLDTDVCASSTRKFNKSAPSCGAGI